MKIICKLVVSLLTLIIAVRSPAQLPVSNLYAFQYKITEQGLDLSNAQYLSAFNARGYNNQPQFISEHELLISSNYFDAQQTDIIKLDLKRKTLTRVTATKQGEYSPTVTPDRRDFTVIREVLGAEVNQILWRYPLSQQDGGKRALQIETTVGYHTWLSGTALATFLVGDPHQLYYHDLREGTKKLISNQPGRAMISSDGLLYYVHKPSDDIWYIKKYDPELEESVIICETLRGSEDFDMLSDGSLLMAKGSKLYLIEPSPSALWKEVADLSELGLNHINRLKVSRNKIILVNAK